MNTVAGLPAHILLNHFVVVLMPLIAILLIICALWPTARQRLVWLVLILAAITLVITPLTVRSGEWLADRADQSPALDKHVSFGENGTYFAVALLIAAALLAAVHVRLQRGHAMPPVLQWTVAVLVIAAAGATMYQIHHIGESGARAAWGSCCQ